MDDPENTDYIAPPTETIKNGFGDCDCQTLALGACYLSFGYAVRFLEWPRHANLQVETREGWFLADLTMSEKFGETPMELRGKEYSVILEVHSIKELGIF